jgi:heme/copper-type cytochrome/quinol oxidase subunit 1
MLAMRGLNRSQRIIAIVGWGVLLWFVGSFVSSLGEPGVFGWVAYAPLSGASSVHAPGTYLTSLEDFFLWLALVVAWVAGAMFLLRTPQKKDEPEV